MILSKLFLFCFLGVIVFLLAYFLVYLPIKYDKELKEKQNNKILKQAYKEALEELNLASNVKQFEDEPRQKTNQ